MMFEKPGPKPKRSKIMNSAVRLHDIRRFMDQPCVRCGKLTHTERNAHYEGIWKYRWGKGLGKKVADELVAWLCMDCTNTMDTKPSKGDHIARLEHDNEWAHLVIKTMLMHKMAS